MATWLLPGCHWTTSCCPTTTQLPPAYRMAAARLSPGCRLLYSWQHQWFSKKSGGIKDSENSADVSPSRGDSCIWDCSIRMWPLLSTTLSELKQTKSLLHQFRSTTIWKHVTKALDGQRHCSSIDDQIWIIFFIYRALAFISLSLDRWGCISALLHLPEMQSSCLMYSSCWGDPYFLYRTFHGTSAETLATC